MHPSTALSDLSQVLWRERETLELVLFKLVEQRLLLGGGQARWLGHATRELDAALDEIGAIELSRALASAAAAAELGVTDDAGLRLLASRAPAPWPLVIERHVGALTRLTEEIVAVAAANRELLDGGIEEVRKSMRHRPRRPSARMLVEFASYHAAISTNERVLQPSLVDAVLG